MRKIGPLISSFLIFSLSIAVGQDWNPDSNSDGVIGTSDLLALLSVFGIDTDQDGLWDGADLCQDFSACNYLDIPSEECLFEDAVGVCGGYCESDTDGDGLCDWICGIDVIDYQNATYLTLQLGNDCWFESNLKSDKYTNGDSIASGLSDSFWASSGVGAFSIPAVEIEGISSYGYLYNNKAIQDARGICPNGWHVSTDDDWMNLEVFLGMNADQVADFGWRGTIEGTKLKNGITDNPEWDGTNDLGFSAVPSGYRNDSNGSPSHLFQGAYFWTSSPYSSLYWFRVLSTGAEGIHRYWSGENSGMSVRCVKDAN